MEDYEKVAVAFATALTEGRLGDAHALLETELASNFAPDRLGEEFVAMWGAYAKGPATGILFDDIHSMLDWPDKHDGDVGWAYVGIQGDDFLEAVSVVICAENGELKIRELDWGRP